MRILGHNFLASNFIAKWTPTFVTAGARQQRTLANIFKYIEGIGCRVVKPIDAEGKNWRIVVDGASDTELPPGMVSPWNKPIISVYDDDEATTVALSPTWGVVKMDTERENNDVARYILGVGGTWAIVIDEDLDDSWYEVTAHATIEVNRHPDNDGYLELGICTNSGTPALLASELGMRRTVIHEDYDVDGGAGSISLDSTCYLDMSVRGIFNSASLTDGEVFLAARYFGVTGATIDDTYFSPVLTIKKLHDGGI